MTAWQCGSVGEILKPQGWAIFMVPLAEHTFEDPSVTDSGEREKLFGQRDHVRRYGPDIANRLTEAGFVVTRHGPEEVAGAEAEKFALLPGDGPVFWCRVV